MTDEAKAPEGVDPETLNNPVSWTEIEPKVTELLDQVELASGHHSNGREACAMDLLVMAVEGEWRDTMECVHPILSKHVHKINDNKYADSGLRRRIVELCGPLLIGTSGWDPVRAALATHRGGLTPEGYAASLAEDITDLGSADLGSADLRFANLGSADLRFADLRFADLGSAVNLEHAEQLQFAFWNDETQWPDGFTPPKKVLS